MHFQIHGVVIQGLILKVVRICGYYQFLFYHSQDLFTIPIKIKSLPLLFDMEYRYKNILFILFVFHDYCSVKV